MSALGRAGASVATGSPNAQSSWRPSVANDKGTMPTSGSVSGIFAIVKPTGHSSMSLLDAMKPLLASSSHFQISAEETGEFKGKSGWKKRKRGFKPGQPNPPKVGQGGTLDPLADGVLVVGIGKGTKELASYLECTKEYRAVALLGASTLSYDSDDPILHRRRHSHIDADAIRAVLPHFRGKGKQLPPLYSAVKVEGRRLLDYAREGRDLPRPVEQRDIEVSALELVEWQAQGEHSYVPARKECSEEERVLAERARKLAGLEKDDVEAAKAGEDNATAPADASDERDVAPAAFTLDMTVSSGTYVRSIVHDVGARAGSAAYVVKLTRTRQGKWVMPEAAGESTADAGSRAPETKAAIPWEVFQRAIDKLPGRADDDRSGKRQVTESGTKASAPEEEKVDEADQARAAGASEQSSDGLAEWERMVLDTMDRM